MYSTNLFKEILKRWDTFDDKFNTLDKKLDTLDKKVGHIYEMVAQNEVYKIHGSQHYSERFEVYDLNGLVWILALKDKIFPMESMVYGSQAYIMDCRDDRIAKHIYVSDPLKT